MNGGLTMQADLFATKGAEYVLVIFFLAALTLFWWWLTAPASGRRPLTAPARTGWFRLRSDYHYHPGHGWTRIEPNGLFAVGLDDFSQHLIGALDRIELPPVGASLRRGAPGWKLEADGRDFEMLSPITGEVVELNRSVLEQPGRIARDPYEEGWLMKVRPLESTGLRHLLTGSVAQAWLRQSEEALRRRTAPAMGAVMQDGGQPVSGIARAVWPDEWDEIVRDFLLTGE